MHNKVRVPGLPGKYITIQYNFSPNFEYKFTKKK